MEDQESQVTGPQPLNNDVRRRMSRQARVGTGPELEVRRILHAMGRRYRVAMPVPGRPRRSMDIAFPRQQVGVFIDGCFWHSCPEHGNAPKNNGLWWAAKLQANVERDRETDDALRSLGWTPLRIWEHVPPAEAAALIVRALDA